MVKVIVMLPVMTALLALILSLALPNSPSAEMDARRISLSSEFADPVKWLNIEGAPYWVGGVEPKYSFGEDGHFVELSPGDDVRLHPSGDCRRN